MGANLPEEQGMVGKKFALTYIGKITTRLITTACIYMNQSTRNFLNILNTGQQEITRCTNTETAHHLILSLPLGWSGVHRDSSVQ